MKKIGLFLCFVFFIVFSIFALKTEEEKTNLRSPLFSLFSPKKEGSEIDCIYCVLAVRLIEQLSIKEEKPVEHVLLDVCNSFPKPLKVVCDTFVILYGDKIAKYLNEGHTIDKVCHKMNLCKRPQCELYPKQRTNEYFPKKFLMKGKKSVKNQKKNLKDNSSQKDEPFWDRILDVFNNHIPYEDEDKDFFSTMFTLRGSAWRGKDCAPKDPTVYPGRRFHSQQNSGIDFSCNGISGINPATGNTYKKDLCEGNDANGKPLVNRGLVVFGDSAGAHFRIPEQLFQASGMNRSLFEHLPQLLENELDFPQLSWGTGYFEKDPTGLAPGKVLSLYQMIRERNLCSHRDYQNICVNGLRATTLHKVTGTFKRDPVNDYPLTVIIEFAGNDVCGHYSSPDEFYSSIVKGLKLLDTMLPNNSYVFFFGVCDARILYDSLHGKLHPLGTPYPAFYDWLSCIDKNPCKNWLTSNSTLRNETAAYAEKLNSLYPKIINDYQFKNFKMGYFPCPIVEIVKEFKKKGLDPSILIEPMDGFHPSQTSQSFFAQHSAEKMVSMFPDSLGQINPNNDKIRQIFGNQGGY